MNFRVMEESLEDVRDIFLGRKECEVMEALEMK